MESVTGKKKIKEGKRAKTSLKMNERTQSIRHTVIMGIESKKENAMRTTKKKVEENMECQAKKKTEAEKMRNEK